MSKRSLTEALMRTRRISIAAAALAASASLVAGNAFAHHAGGPTNANGAGPITTITATTLPQGAFVAGAQFDWTDMDALSDDVLIEAAEAAFLAGEEHAHFHSVETISVAALMLAYGAAEHLTVSLRLPYVWREDIREGHAHEESPGVPHGSVHDFGNSSGIGDLSLLGQMRFLNERENGFEMAALFGVEMPTGDTDELNDEGDPFDAEFQPGSDSWDVLLGAAVTKRLQRFAFDASGLYTVAGDGDDGNLGDRFAYGVAGSYRAIGMEAHTHPEGTPEHSDGFALDLVLELNGEWHDNQEEGHEVDPNSGGHVLFVSPGIRISSDGYSAYAAVGLPVMTDMNGLQDEPDLRLVGGVSAAF
jgi:hypothetical protein